MRQLAEAAGASVSQQPPAESDSRHTWLVIGNADAKTKEAAWAKKKLPTGQATSGILCLLLSDGEACCCALLGTKAAPALSPLCSVIFFVMMLTGACSAGFMVHKREALTDSIVRQQLDKAQDVLLTAS